MPRFILIFIASVWFLSGCEQPSVQRVDEQASSYKADIIRTTHGVAHITAADYPSLGFGEGYAAAEDHICNIAHSIVVARAERSKYHGMGEQKQHFMSDVVVRALSIPDRAAEAFQQQDEEFKGWLTGYASGYNHYLAETGSDNVGSWCAGAEWLKPISAEDIFMRALTLANTATKVPAMMASAKPPQSEKSALFMPLPDNVMEQLTHRYLGSNAWAFGKDRTENKRGLLLANPHYPWTGGNRFWEKHLTIPGKLNVYGVHLLGAPGVAIGFNQSVGWSHTVSDSERTVFYQLKLVPDNPTQYYYEGEIKEMTRRDLAIEVKGEDKPVSHTVWFSHHGPIVNLPGVGWTDKMALSMRDANLDNFFMLAQWKDMGESESMDELIAAHQRWNAMPWVNTMATSADGRAVYMDGSNVGHLSTDAIQLWKDSIQTKGLAQALYHRQNLVVLDGSDKRFEWESHPDSVIEGNVPFAQKPLQDRSDYIFNANDSYWLTNVSEPMAEHSPLFGPHATARSLRTRMNAMLVANDNRMGYAGEDGLFSMAEMQQAIMANDSAAAQLVVDDLVANCSETPSITLEGVAVDLEESCQVMKQFDRQFNLDSQGSALFREWIASYAYSQTKRNGDLFAVPFDPASPVTTPNTLADKDKALSALAKASQLLSSAGFKLNSAMGETQFAYRANDRIAIHGGNEMEGVANVIGQRVYDSLAFQERGQAVEGSRFLKDKGYPVTYGTSFIMTLSYTDSGPVAEAFLTYGQSGDPGSEWYTDQTKLFSSKAWRPVLFTSQQIDSATIVSKTVSAPQ